MKDTVRDAYVRQGRAGRAVCNVEVVTVRGGSGSGGRGNRTADLRRRRDQPRTRRTPITNTSS